MTITRRIAEAINMPPNRVRKEGEGIAARQQQGAAEVLLQHRAEDEAEHERRRFTFEFDKDVSEQAEKGRQCNIEGIVRETGNADSAKQQNGRKKQNGKGTESRRTHIPIRGRLKMTSIRLPIHMLAIIPRRAGVG